MLSASKQNIVVFTDWYTMIYVQVFGILMAVSGSPEEKAGELQATMKDGGAAHAAFSSIEKLIAASTTQYYVGDALSVADVLVYAFIGWVASGCAGSHTSYMK